MDPLKKNSSLIHSEKTTELIDAKGQFAGKEYKTLTPKNGYFYDSAIKVKNVFLIAVHIPMKPVIKFIESLRQVALLPAKDFALALLKKSKTFNMENRVITSSQSEELESL